MASTFTTLRFGAKERHEAHDESQDQLLERVRRGDPKAVGVLYDRYHDVVRAFAARILGEDSTAEDLVHEVFVVLPKALRRYRGDSALQSYILGITANRSKHYIRAACRRRAAHDRMAKDSPAPMVDPETMVQRQELAAALRRAIDSLPQDQKVAFVLCEIEERSSYEVAEITKVPAATVRTRLFHARKKLRVFLEREGVR